MIVVRRIPTKGRAVFTTAPIARGALIVREHVLVVRFRDLQGRVRDYPWDWRGGRVGLGLGFSSLVNHDDAPNVGVRRLYARQLIELRALRRIEAGEELTVSYGQGVAF